MVGQKSINQLVLILVIYIYSLLLCTFDMLQKNKMLAGVLTGALISAVGNNSRDKVIEDAITGGTIAIAAVFLQYLA